MNLLIILLIGSEVRRHRNYHILKTCNMSKKYFFLAAVLAANIFICGDCLSQMKTKKVADALIPINSGEINIKGYLGAKIDSCIKNGIMGKEYNLYIKPYSLRNDDPQGFQGEFWGKWFTSAAMAYGYKPTNQYRQIIDDAVKGLKETQSPDGRLSSYKNDFGEWDIWGRKYALLGLVAHYDRTGDFSSLEAAKRSLDNLISVTGPGKTKITETGVTVLDGLSSASILEPIVLIYQRTGERRYLDFAKYLVKLWSEPGTHSKTGIRLIEDGLNNTHPMRISAAKGYEETSCYEGLCELYRVTGEKKYLNAAINYGKKVIEKEIMIVGSGSSAELWCDGVMRQTELIEEPMETCVTATWIKFCYQLLRLTGDPRWADQMEISLYNALLGAMANNGHWWAYFSGLQGERVPSIVQVASCKSSCCVTNGARGMMTVPGWSVMRSNVGPVINLYSNGEWSSQLPSGNGLKIEQKTSYPQNGDVEIRLSQQKTENYTLQLRMPAWSDSNRVWINGNLVSQNAKGYVKLKRLWRDGDIVKINFNMKGKVVKAPGNPNQMAVTWGPVVLALDSRFVKEEKFNVWLLHDGYRWKYDKNWNLNYALLKEVDSVPKESYIDLKPIIPAPEGVWLAFEVPFLYRPTHFFEHKKIKLTMCDYASAGNKYTADNLFRVWLPQPIYLTDIFLRDTWRTFWWFGERPVMPTFN